jgi:hypothetical protein
VGRHAAAGWVHTSCAACHGRCSPRQAAAGHVGMWLGAAAARAAPHVSAGGWADSVASQPPIPHPRPAAAHLSRLLLRGLLLLSGEHRWAAVRADLAVELVGARLRIGERPAAREDCIPIRGSPAPYTARKHFKGAASRRVRP